MKQMQNSNNICKYNCFYHTLEHIISLLDMLKKKKKYKHKI